VIEDALRERLTTSVGSQISSESWKKQGAKIVEDIRLIDQLNQSLVFFRRQKPS